MPGCLGFVPIAPRLVGQHEQLGVPLPSTAHSHVRCVRGSMPTQRHNAAEREYMRYMPIFKTVIGILGCPWLGAHAAFFYASRVLTRKLSEDWRGRLCRELVKSGSALSTYVLISMLAWAC